MRSSTSPRTTSSV